MRMARRASSSEARPPCAPRANRKSSASMPSRATAMGFIRWLRLKARRVSAASSGLSSTSRMTLFESFMACFLQAEEERCPVAGHRVHPDLPPVPAEDALHDGQPDARARELALVMQALEGTEQAVRIGHVEAHPVVGDEAVLVAIVLHHAHADDRLVRPAG